MVFGFLCSFETTAENFNEDLKNRALKISKITSIFIVLFHWKFYLTSLSVPLQGIFFGLVGNISWTALANRAHVFHTNGLYSELLKRDKTYKFRLRYNTSHLATYFSINDNGHKQPLTCRPIKSIQSIYTLHNKILTIGSSTLNYDTINNQILKCI